MATRHRTPYYTRELESGQWYQDYVAENLLSEGIPIVSFQSREFQLTRGENALGLEIKYDKKFGDTGRFWIEVAEKSDPEIVTWTPSGIDRDDNAWLYGIGDEYEFFVFSKRTLKRYREVKQPEIVINNMGTSRGFLLPRALAAELVDRVFVFALRPQHVEDVEEF
jgi:hypothetical protein